MSEPIQQGCGKMFLPHHRIPIAKFEIGGNDDRTAFVERRAELEELGIALSDLRLAERKQVTLTGKACACSALQQRIHLSPSPHFMGIVAQLGYLLTQTGFQHIGTDVSVLDYSYAHEEANQAWLESFHALISESSLFLIQSGVTTPEELAQVNTQLMVLFN